jgi:hypothetical protein
VELVEDDELGFSVPFELAGHLPVGTGVEIEINTGLEELAGERRFPHLPWSRNEDDFFSEVPLDGFFQVSPHVAIMHHATK